MPCLLKSTMLRAIINRRSQTHPSHENYLQKSTRVYDAHHFIVSRLHFDNHVKDETNLNWKSVDYIFFVFKFLVRHTNQRTEACPETLCRCDIFMRTCFAIFDFIMSPGAVRCGVKHLRSSFFCECPCVTECTCFEHVGCRRHLLTCLASNPSLRFVGIAKKCTLLRRRTKNFWSLPLRIRDASKQLSRLANSATAKIPLHLWHISFTKQSSTSTDSPTRTAKVDGIYFTNWNMLLDDWSRVGRGKPSFNTSIMD